MKRLDKMRDANGNLPSYAFPGGYTIIYWMKQDESVYPLCGDCAERFAKGEYGYDVEFVEAETGDHYEESLLCDNCSKQLADYYDEEETE